MEEIYIIVYTGTDIPAAYADRVGLAGYPLRRV